MKKIIVSLWIMSMGCHWETPCQQTQDALQELASSYLSLYLLSDDIHAGARHRRLIEELKATCGGCDGVVERMESVK